MYHVIQCRFSEFLIQLCIENAFFLGPCRNITTMCRKSAFFWVRAEILLSRDKVSLESFAGPFLGFFGEIFTSEWAVSLFGFRAHLTWKNHNIAHIVVQIQIICWMFDTGIFAL